jgi:hypothetical protein
MTALPDIPRARFYEFCAAVFDLQLQPVVCAGARESFITRVVL